MVVVTFFGEILDPLLTILSWVRGYGDVGRSCAYSPWLCDVPVLLQYQFQQSKVYVNMKVSQIQFVDRVLDIPVMQQRQVRTVPTSAETRHSTDAVLGQGC